MKGGKVGKGKLGSDWNRKKYYPSLPHKRRGTWVKKKERGFSLIRAKGNLRRTAEMY